MKIPRLISLSLKHKSTTTTTTTPATSTADWKTYTNSNYKYSFKYPTDWDLSDKAKTYYPAQIPIKPLSAIQRLEAYNGQRSSETIDDYTKLSWSLPNITFETTDSWRSRNNRSENLY
jgi:hypothetical protein